MTRAAPAVIVGPVMSVLKTSVGRKLAMAGTGQLLLLFLLGHAVGNGTLWVGAINSYAAHLHALPPLVLAFRLALLALISLHLWQGIALTLENRAAGGGGYAVTA